MSLAAAEPAAEAASEMTASSSSAAKPTNPHPSATLLSTEIFDILRGYSGTLGPLIFSSYFADH